MSTLAAPEASDARANGLAGTMAGKIMDLRMEGLSMEDIAERLGTDVWTVRRICRLPHMVQALAEVVEERKEHALLRIAEMTEPALEVYHSAMCSTEAEPVPDVAVKVAKDIFDRIGATVDRKGPSTVVTVNAAVVSRGPEAFQAIDTMLEESDEAPPEDR